MYQIVEAQKYILFIFRIGFRCFILLAAKFDVQIVALNTETFRF